MEVLKPLEKNLLLFIFNFVYRIQGRGCPNFSAMEKAYNILLKFPVNN